ncbi:phosphotransferase [Isoptericola variabilis]|uniref:phosphotransferase n=1 Tax=Isoptericola variabilis TaxID=139208 RepID=UPI000673FF35|nr:phosphotransferase [Isoptericola variabilis]
MLDRKRAERVRELWKSASAAPWDGREVWFHGDVAVGNLLVRDGALAAVIDFGTTGVGDPACDLAIAWTVFEPGSRTVFLETLDADPSTVARASGWALWKTLAGYADDVDDGVDVRPDVAFALDQLLSDPALGGAGSVAGEGAGHRPEACR